LTTGCRKNEKNDAHPGLEHPHRFKGIDVTQGQRNWLRAVRLWLNPQSGQNLQPIDLSLLIITA